jgi:hypothetical protein
MRLQLRHNVHWCECGGRAVFLDLDADRYVCLPAAANQAFLRFAAGQIRGQDAAELRQLVEWHILVECPETQPVRQPPWIEPPARDWPASPPSRPGLSPILRSLASEVRWILLLRTRPFAEVLGAAKRQGAGTEASPDEPKQSLDAIVAAADPVSCLLRAHDRCLVRALAVHSLCKRRGIRSRLVIGVVANPFAAHCWVQLGKAVLVGGYEQARLYTPILVLE